MADANKTVRLSKAAREFNLGIGTIADFLETKGIQVEAKPNTKLGPDVYAIVRNNFQGDKDAKEAAQRSTVSVDRETIRLASAKKKEVVKEDSPAKRDLSIFKKEEKEKKPGKTLVANEKDELESLNSESEKKNTELGLEANQELKNKIKDTVKLLKNKSRISN